MKLAPRGPIGIQEPSLLLEPLGRVASALGDVEPILRLAKFNLDPWQTQGLDLTLGERADRKWSATECAIFASRRQGKGGIVYARELGGMFVLDDFEIRHTAHRVDTVKAAAEKVWDLIRFSPELLELAGGPTAYKYAHEEISITIKATGAKTTFTTRTAGSMRGLDGDLIVLDELLYMIEEGLGDAIPTILARPNPQIIYSSSGALAKSVLQHLLRRRAMLLLERRANGDRATDDGQFGYIEWQQPVKFDDKRRIVLADPVEEDDIEAWRRGAPALGYRVTLDKINTVRKAMTKAGEFRREIVGVWDAPPEDIEKLPAKMPAGAWERTGITPARAETRWPKPPTAAAFAIDPDGRSGTISIGAGSLTGAACYVEVAKFDVGATWIADAVVQLLKTYRKLKVGCNGSSFSGTQVGAVLSKMLEEKIDKDRLVVLGTTDYRKACGGFYTDVTEFKPVMKQGKPIVRDGVEVKRPRLQRPIGQGVLDAAVLDAAERKLRGGFEFEPRDPTIPGSPLESIVVVRALLPAKVNRAPGAPSQLAPQAASLFRPGARLKI